MFDACLNFILFLANIVNIFFKSLILYLKNSKLKLFLQNLNLSSDVYLTKTKLIVLFVSKIKQILMFIRTRYRNY